MKTHSDEEKCDFLSVSKINNLFIVLFLLVSTFYSQINLNGFGEIDELIPTSNAVSLISVPIDLDNKPDFIITTGQKSLVLYISGKEYKPKSIKTPYLISTVKRVRKISDSESEYAFISRKEKIFGTFVLNSGGWVANFKTLKFNYNPENFVLSRNGKKAIIFGNNFNGLVFVDLNLGKEDILTFLDNKIIKDALFYDFDNDLNTDIVYYDIFSESINLIKNEVNFQLTEIDLNSKVRNLTHFRKADFNYDGFEDLIFSSERGIEIFKGDSVNTFDKRELLVTARNIVDFQLGDLNRDGYFDVVFRTEKKNTQNQTYISFSSLDKLSTPFLIPLKESIISFDVAGWRKDELVLLTTDGNLYRLSAIGEMGNKTILLGNNPISIFSFKKKNSLLFNIAILDSTDHKLKIYTNALGNYFEVPLKSIHSNIAIQNISDFELLFVLYTPNNKLIEVNKLNLQNGSIWSEQFYTTNKIKNIVIETRPDTLPAIQILTTINSKAVLEEFTFRDMHYQKVEVHLEIDSVFSAELTRHNSIIYLKKNSQSEMELREESITNNNTGTEFSHKVMLIDSTISLPEIRQFEINGREFSMVSFSSGKKKSTYLYLDEQIVKAEKYFIPDDLHFLSISINSIAEFVYKSGDKILFSEMNLKTGNIQNTKVISDVKGDFTVQYVNRKNGYIFMINNQENLIELKKIE